MFKAILRQLLYVAALILAVLVLNFLLIQLAPGDPAEVIAGEMGGANAEVMAAIREQYGLDKPVLTQLALYLGRALQGDLGTSYFYNRPVAELILSRLGPTLLLVATALAFALIIGTRLGMLASRNPRGIASALVTVLSLVGYSAPVFWTGLMLVILFGATIPLFPIAGMIDVVKQGGPLGRALDIAHHLVLPALTLGLVYLAQYSRLTRAAMLEVLGADYIRTARAKGVSERQVFGRHAFRNALLPVVTVAGMQFGTIISGAVLVETVFSWPGLGTLAFQSILARDYPTVMGILFFSTLIVIIANLLTDFISRLLDPRLAGGR
ncbi:ABC transporter permease subunit [Paracoccus kondratievae]|uniref:Transporter n=1 Tax=Paracoccus kondratievae TaxID=135740 RepID=A0AAD3P1T6_9RHOB|nr:MULTISPECIES: ABC transporter permease [Paracoccus]QFQ88561.1 ABC transporter permease subunit [Paracoccus kondratievae]GLK65706.1 transporter [Paracoccus kondratievae]SMG50781.1 peptide/nickel transport system permease protein [Paracoccus sp. J56]